MSIANFQQFFWKELSNLGLRRHCSQVLWLWCYGDGVCRVLPVKWGHGKNISSKRFLLCVHMRFARAPVDSWIFTSVKIQQEGGWEHWEMFASIPGHIPHIFPELGQASCTCPKAEFWDAPPSVPACLHNLVISWRRASSHLVPYFQGKWAFRRHQATVPGAARDQTVTQCDFSHMGRSGLAKTKNWLRMKQKGSFDRFLGGVLDRSRFVCLGCGKSLLSQCLVISTFGGFGGSVLGVPWISNRSRNFSDHFVAQH